MSIQLGLGVLLLLVVAFVVNWQWADFRRR